MRPQTRTRTDPRVAVLGDGLASSNFGSSMPPGSLSFIRISSRRSGAQFSAEADLFCPRGCDAPCLQLRARPRRIPPPVRPCGVPVGPTPLNIIIDTIKQLFDLFGARPELRVGVPHELGPRD
jgi:hypothetical protein